MDELVARSGDDEIEFALTWLDGGPRSTGAEATHGCLRVCLRGHPVWHGEDDAAGVEWTWIELLEFLGEYWLYLSVEDGCPLGVALSTAVRMQAAAEAAIDLMPDAEAEVQSEQLETYRLTHDLAKSLQGAVSPPLWVVRDGNNGWMAPKTRGLSSCCSDRTRIKRRQCTFAERWWTAGKSGLSAPRVVPRCNLLREFPTTAVSCLYQRRLCNSAERDRDSSLTLELLSAPCVRVPFGDAVAPH